MKRIISSLILSLTMLCAEGQSLYVGSFYVTSPEEEALLGDGGDKWAKRRPVICDMFKYEQPDVLGLQGLTASQLTSLKSGTSYLTAENILYSRALALDTCGVASDMPEGTSCSWARLRKEDKPFYVINFSFSTSTATAFSAAVRLRAFIDELNAEDLPCVVVGYLGVSETKTAYTRLAAKFNDCFKKAPVVSAEYGTVNNFDLAANHGADRLDYVFVSRDFNIKAYGQLQYGYFTQESDGTYKRRLPSAHFPVMAKVTLP